MRRKTIERMEIDAPKFDRYEDVILRWNERDHATRSVARWFDPDDEYRWYRSRANAPSEELYPESSLRSRDDSRGE